MTTQHTPGPWRHVLEARELPLSFPYSIMATETNRLVAFVQRRDDLHEQDANARLIAHAWAIPQLVEAVKAMQGACDEWADEFTQRTRAMNWGKVNDAYMQARAALRAVEEEKP